MKRRQLLHYAALFGASNIVSLGVHGCALRNNSRAGAIGPHGLTHPGTAQPRLVIVFLRGAADGLNIIIPHHDPHYYEARPNVAIAPPGQNNGALDLDGYFGLHPALGDLLTQWQKGHMAVVHGSGLPHPIRSHFEAQDYMEIGIPGTQSVSDGWMNRMLNRLMDQTPTPTSAINMGSLTPLIFSGSASVANVGLGPNGIAPLATDYPALQRAFDQLYSGDDPLSRTYRQGRQTRELLLQELDKPWSRSVQATYREARPNASGLSGFAYSAAALAQLIKGDTQTQLAFMELGGWDTHVNQTVHMDQQLAKLNDGLATLIHQLGDVYRDTTIVVMSEFGRTVAENGSRGTEHGHGNIMLLLGGGLKGQAMYGRWSGLGESNLNEGRDLAVTTDFRDVLASILSQQWDFNSNELDQIFPDYAPGTSLSDHRNSTWPLQRKQPTLEFF